MRKFNIICRFCDAMHSNMENCPACAKITDPVVRARRKLFYAIAHVLPRETDSRSVRDVAEAVELLARVVARGEST